VHGGKWREWNGRRVAQRREKTRQWRSTNGGIKWRVRRRQARGGMAHRSGMRTASRHAPKSIKWRRERRRGVMTA